MNLATPLPNQAASPSSSGGSFLPKPPMEPQEWHKNLAHYLANGMDHDQCAQLVGCNTRHVAQVLQYPWFQELIADALAIRNKDVGELFRGAALVAFAALLDVCTNPKAPPAARLKAAEIITNRNLGAIPQTVNYTNDDKSIKDPVAEEEKLKQRLEALRNPNVEALAEED